MSATLEQGLASLLVHRTEEGRTKAQHAIDAWQKAIEAVREAEKKADHKINLPDDQVLDIQQAAAQVRRVSYVQAVYFEKKATVARNAIITTTIGVLREESSKQEGKMTLAQQALQTASSEYDRTISAAKEEERAKIRRIYDETVGSLRHFEVDDGFFPLVIIANIVALYFYGDLLDPPKDPLIQLILAAAGIYVGSFIEIMIVVEMVDWIRKMKAEATQHSRIVVAETAFKRAFEAAEKRLGETRSMLEQKIWNAETQRKKASDTLLWFQSQVSTIK